MTEIEALKERLANLESLVEQLASVSGKVDIPSQTSILINARLEQNESNPSNGMTRVGYVLPEGKTGELIITAIDGKELQRISLSQKGKGQVDLQTRNLPAGTYNYSLIVNGQIIDTKRMVIK